MGIVFKASEVPAGNDYAPITPGVYNVQMDTVEEKQTLAGGVSWNLKMKIVSEAFKGRTFFLSYNVENANKTTQDIARREIAQIAELVGASDDISIESIKTNSVFSITLEQRPVGDKVYYNAKNWALTETVKKSVATAPSTTTKAKPWAK
jgi:hypothetical protein